MGVEYTSHHSYVILISRECPAEGINSYVSVFSKPNNMSQFFATTFTEIAYRSPKITDSDEIRLKPDRPILFFHPLLQATRGILKREVEHMPLLNSNI